MGAATSNGGNTTIVNLGRLLLEIDPSSALFGALQAVVNPVGAMTLDDLDDFNDDDEGDEFMEGQFEDDMEDILLNEQEDSDQADPDEGMVAEEVEDEIIEMF
jgi:hypothetical protein